MSANILKDMANPRSRVMPLEENQRLRSKIETEKKDQRGDSPEYSREMKKHLITDPPGSNEVGKNENRINLKRMEVVADRQGVRTLSKADTILLEKRAAELKAKLRRMMVPQEDTELTPSKPGGAASQEFRRAVSAMAEGEMSPKFRAIAHELKNILRQLGKDDPDAGNFENFRPKRGEV